MKRWILPLLSAALVTCADPSQHNETHYGRVKVAFGAPLDLAGPWRDDQLVELRNELRNLSALGPTFVETDEGMADIVIRPFDSGPMCAHGAGRYTTGNDYAEVDPACCEGYDQLRTAAGHEIGHFLGMEHVCRQAGEAPDCDAAVGYGAALMNPNVAYDLNFNENLDVTYSQDTPTELDLTEYRRVRP